MMKSLMRIRDLAFKLGWNRLSAAGVLLGIITCLMVLAPTVGAEEIPFPPPGPRVSRVCEISGGAYGVDLFWPQAPLEAGEATTGVVNLESASGDIVVELAFVRWTGNVAHFEGTIPALVTFPVTLASGWVLSDAYPIQNLPMVITAEGFGGCAPTGITVSTASAVAFSPDGWVVLVFMLALILVTVVFLVIRIMSIRRD